MKKQLYHALYLIALLIFTSSCLDEPTPYIPEETQHCSLDAIDDMIILYNGDGSIHQITQGDHGYWYTYSDNQGFKEVHIEEFASGELVQEYYIYLQNDKPVRYFSSHENVTLTYGYDGHDYPIRISREMDGVVTRYTGVKQRLSYVITSEDESEHYEYLLSDIYKNPLYTLCFPSRKFSPFLPDFLFQNLIVAEQDGVRLEQYGIQALGTNYPSELRTPYGTINFAYVDCE